MSVEDDPPEPEPAAEIGDEMTVGAWLDADDGERETPPEGDLPDDFGRPAESRGGTWSRILRALRGR